MIRPGAGDPTETDQFADVEGSLTGFFKIDDHGELHLYDGPETNDWLPTGAKFELDDAGNAKNWIRLSFRQDFENGLWDVAINGDIFRANLAMAQPADTLEKIEFIGQSKLPLVIDNIQVSRHATAFEDQDRDGLPDDWEEAHGLVTLDHQRDADPDEDGLTNIEELVLGTRATGKDTDGDGMNDGDEYASNKNPLLAEDSDSEQAASSYVTSGYLTLEGVSCTDYSLGMKLSLLSGYHGDIVTMSVNASMLYPIDTSLYTYNWVSNGRGEIWCSTPTYVDGGELNVAVTDQNGDYYFGTFGFSCGCACGCVDVWVISSIDFKIGVGSNDFGRFGQDLVVKERTWSDALYSRHSVQYAGARREGRAHQSKVTIEGHEYLALDWVLSDTQFTQLVDLPHGYAIEAYHLDQVDPDHNVTGAPFKRYRIENPDPDGLSPYKRLRITQEGSRPAVREYRFREVNGIEEWELFEGGPDYLERPMRYHKATKYAERSSTTKKANGYEVEWRQKGHWDPRTQSLVIDEEKELTYQNLRFGRKLVKEIADPYGQALTTKHGYLQEFKDFDPVKNHGGFAQLKPQWVEYPDGRWEWYGYDQSAHRNRVVRPIGNTPRPAALPEPGPGFHVTMTAFDPNASTEIITEVEDGITTKITHKSWQQVSERILREETRVSYGDSSSEQEVTITLRDPQTRQLLRQENPDGTLITIERQTDGDLRTETRFSGAADRSYGTETVTVTHRSGLVMEEKVTDLPSGILTKHEKTLEHDQRYRPLFVSNELEAKVSSKGYDCCDLEWETNEDGSARTYQRDVLGRLTGQQTGYKNPLDRGNTLATLLGTQDYQLDGLDRRRQTSDGHHTASTEYNLAGQRTATTNRTGLETRYKTIMLENGGRLELTSLPRSGQDQKHRITSQQYTAEGKLTESKTYASDDPFATTPDPGTTLNHQQFAEGQDEKGRYDQVTQIASLFDRRVTRTFKDTKGRTTQVIQAYGTRNAGTTQYDYNEKDHLIRITDPDEAVTRYAYNEKGERTTIAIDLHIEPNESANHIDWQTDRITQTKTQLAPRETGVPPVRRTTTTLYTEKGPHITTISEQSLDGQYSATTQNGQTATRIRREGTLPGTWTITDTQPAGHYTVQHYENGRLVKTVRHGNNDAEISWTQNQYDEQNRLWKVTDSRTGTTTYHYNEKGQRWKTSAPGSADVPVGSTLDTLYEYDALGQLTKTTKPSGGEVYQVYNTNGTLAKTHGHHTTDVAYGYNTAGECTSMTTWYGPESKPATTKWRFNARGQLAYKQDAAGKRVHYTYTPGGKLKTRTWARGIVTRYHYDQVGQLRHVDYSDNTPDVYYTYTRLGQKHTVKGAGGLTEYTYRQDNPLALQSEIRRGIRQDSTHLPSSNSHLQDRSELYGEEKVLTYLQDDHHRPAGFQIGTLEDPNQDYEVRYGYDHVNRLSNVAAQGYWFEYDYLENSTTDRLHKTRAPFIKETEWTYEPGRDTITSVTNRVGFHLDQQLSQYTYENNADAQRTARTSTQAGNEWTDHFTYDPDTGGVTASNPNTEERDPEAYAYDRIGNRLKATIGSKTTKYEANALNQYSSIQSPSPSSLATRPTFDLDGNQTHEDNRTYTWDAENRLVAIHEGSAVIAKYTYDHQSRRIARWVHDGTDERYLYEGWNLIAVYQKGQTNPVETYTWGKDLSGTLQGAGGVGGLLFAQIQRAKPNTWIYSYDANGNVTQVTDPRGTILEQNTYDAFGNPTTTSQIPNRYRFSTKPQDSESGFNYYGYRYYDPEKGRWLSRDLIEEKGGLHLYAGCYNDFVSGFDLLGMLRGAIAFDVSVDFSGNQTSTVSYTERVCRPTGVYPNYGAVVCEDVNRTHTKSLQLDLRVNVPVEVDFTEKRLIHPIGLTPTASGEHWGKDWDLTAGPVKLSGKIAVNSISGRYALNSDLWSDQAVPFMPGFVVRCVTFDANANLQTNVTKSLSANYATSITGPAGGWEFSVGGGRSRTDPVSFVKRGSATFCAIGCPLANQWEISSYTGGRPYAP